MANFYDILDVSRGASQDEIKRAFRKKAMEFHPDRNKSPDAEEKFKEINKAYETLSDPDKRSRYDQFGEAGVSGDGFGSGGFTGNFEDIFSNFTSNFGGDIFGDIEDMFGGFGGFGDIFGRKGNSKNNNLDIVTDLKVSFIQSIIGGSKEFEYNLSINCDLCDGTGASNQPNSIFECSDCNGSGVKLTQKTTPLGVMQFQSKCNTCNGTGEIIKNKCNKCNGKKQINKKTKVSIDIEPGIQNGQTLVVSGKGNQSKNVSGNLYINIFVEHSKIFQRNGNKLYVELLIDPIKAIVGGITKVPTPYGIIEIKLKPYTPNGEEIIIPNKGIKSSGLFKLKNDLIAIVTYTSPKKYNSKDLEILSKFINKDNDELNKQILIAEKEIQDAKR